MIDSGKEEKFCILAYTEPERNGVARTFEFNANPLEISSRHENQFSPLLGINTSGRTASYMKSLSDVLAVRLLIDNTVINLGIFSVGPAPPPSVADQVKDFLEICAFMEGDIHEPRFLKVNWGSINFECRLKSVEVKYTHFDEKGNPLRAELDTVFVSDMPQAKRIRLENKKSPDITHTHIVQAGDTLTGLCKQVYGDAEAYLMVAKANQMDHFRILFPGQEIFFPPLEQ